MGDTGKIMKFPRESIILGEGDTNTDMYKIIKGHVELYTGYGTGHEVLLGIIGQQSCFGEFGLLLHQPAIYTAIAFDDVFALRITEGEIGDFVQENHRNIIEIMRNMSRMMLKMQQQIEMLSEDLENGREPDPEIITRVRRNIRGYAVYNPCIPASCFTGNRGVMNCKI